MPWDASSSLDARIGAAALSGHGHALAALADEARTALAMLAYPDRDWVRAPAPHPSGAPVHDVLVVGGGQSGLAVCAMLRAQGVTRVAVLDRAPAGTEGVWERFARMPELRTPKRLNGMEMGIPALGVQRWWMARFGAASWLGIERIPRVAWMDYLRWYRATLRLPVENDCAVDDIAPEAGGLLRVETTVAGTARTRFARLVVLATGQDGGGAWRVPAAIAAQLPAERCRHTSDDIDFAALAGLRVGILGHGASAFDNAVAALEAGARSVDLCFRRARLPRVNPHRHIETAGLMTHYPKLADATRWRIARHFRRVDQPPPRASFERALAHPGFALRPGCAWTQLRWTGREIQIDSPQGRLCVDHVLCATGLQPDLGARAELARLRPAAARWRDRYAPPAAEADEALGELPYLGLHYEFVPRMPGDDDWVSRVFAFNGASAASHGPHSTSISGHKHALPRLVRGLTGRLFLDQEDTLVDELARYDEVELPLADDFEASQCARAGTVRPMA